MFKTSLRLVAASTLFVLGCGDSPTQPGTPTPFPTPVRTPFPTPSLVPVVWSAEPTTRYYGFPGWIIRGSHFMVDEKVTLESDSSVAVLQLEELGRPDFVGGYLLPGTAPGMYTPCVETIHGKGCGSFLVTVK